MDSGTPDVPKKGARKYRPRKSVVCGCCGESGESSAKGYRSACYARWMYSGFPAGGPRPPQSRREIGVRNFGAMPPGPREKAEAAADRREDYAWLTRTMGASLKDAAAQLGISVKTAQRYEKVLKANEPGS